MRSNTSHILNSPGMDSPATASTSFRVDSQVCPVQVLVRCRPVNEKEKSHGISIKASEITRRSVTVHQKLVHGKEIAKTFSFDQVYGPVTTQAELFNTSIKPIVNEVLEGFSCTIFAYGQTSTGKTYTMEGARNSKTNEIVEMQAGVIPRSVAHIFDTLERNKSEYTVKLVCLELYNEELQDLLSSDPPVSTNGQASKDSGSKLKIFDDASKGTSVHGAEEVVVQDTDHVMKILDQAAKKRQMAETLLNKQSSRSHAITTITIHIRDQTPDGEEFIKTGKLNLVDLAGSENIGRSGAQNKRAKEAGMINQSLLTLGRVITALTEKCPHVPYRESKLTRLLQDSLGGKTKTCIIATISPSVTCLEETMSTLDYANRAKSIKNKPELNMKISKGAMIREMASECDQLRQMLLMQRNKAGGIFLSTEQFEEKEKLIQTQTEKIDTLKSEMEIMKKENDMAVERIREEQERLRIEKDAHSVTRSYLETAKQTIQENEKEINGLNETLSETRYVLENKEVSEKQLYNEAAVLLSNLRQSESDVEILVDSVETQRQIHDHNESTVFNTSDSLTNQVYEVLKSLNEFRQIYSKISTQDFASHLESFQQNRSRVMSELLEKHTSALLEQFVVNRDKISKLVEKHVSETHSNETTSKQSQDQFEEMLTQTIQTQLTIAQKSLKDIQNELLSYHDYGVQWMKDYVLETILHGNKQLVDSYTEKQLALMQETLKRVNENTAAQLKTIDQYKQLFSDLVAKQDNSHAQFKKQLLSKVEQLVDECVATNSDNFRGGIASVDKSLSHISDQVQIFKKEFMHDTDKLSQQSQEYMATVTQLSNGHVQHIEERYKIACQMKNDNYQNADILSKMLESQSGQFSQHMQSQLNECRSILQKQTESVNNLKLDCQLVHDRHTRSFEEDLQSTREGITYLEQDVISPFISNIKENNLSAENVSARMFEAGVESHNHIQARIGEMRTQWKINSKTCNTPPRKRKRTTVDSINAIRTYDEIARERIEQQQHQLPQILPMTDEDDCVPEEPVFVYSASEDQENQAPLSPNTKSGSTKPVYGPQKPTNKRPSVAFSPQNGKRRRKLTSGLSASTSIGGSKILHTRSSSSQFR